MVALLMPNRAEYLAIWLGITRIGGVVALINTNLAARLWRIACTSPIPGTFIVGGRVGADAGCRCDRGAGLATWMRSFCGLLAALSGRAAFGKRRARASRSTDPALLIYTSGTTGLPKAAFVSHHRVMMWTHWFAGMMGARSDDRLYNCLPMYHSVGGVVASGAVLLKGGAVICGRNSPPALSGTISPKAAPPSSNISANCAAIC